MTSFVRRLCRTPAESHRRLAETAERFRPHCLESGGRSRSYSSRSARLLTTRLRVRSLGEDDVFTSEQHGSTAGVDLHVGSSEFA